MNEEFSQEFKDFLKSTSIDESAHYACWIAYNAGKLKGQMEETEKRIEQLTAEIKELRESRISADLNLPSKEDALPDNLLSFSLYKKGNS